MAGKLTEKQIADLRLARWRARTDLVYLCQEILHYPNVEREMHGPILDVLQKFPRPTGKQAVEHDTYDPTKRRFQYKPLKETHELPGKRRALILWPRSTLKTTTNIQGHSIQWIINYPDIALALFHSNIDKVNDLVQEIKRHFQYNETFRELFPELCPLADKAKDFGKADRFTTPGRIKGRKEPTLIGVSLEKGATGMHFDVMKFTDIIELENVKTEERRFQIKKEFYGSEPLLVTPDCWIDVEGTRYHQEDLYGELLDKWLTQKKAGIEPSYNIAISSCWKREYPDNKPFYTPDSLFLPFAKDAEGKLISIWPHDNQGRKRLTYDYLLELKLTSPYIYSTQYLNTPEGGVDGREIFEVSDSRPAWISTTNFYTNVRVAYRVMSIDTAETNQEYSNNSAIAIGAWGTDNRCYVEDIQHGKFLPNELIHFIVEMAKKYQPQTIFIEKTSFVTGLMVGLNAAMYRAGLFIPIEQVRRSTKLEKLERIQNSLQPWYKPGLLRFVIKEEGESDNSPLRGGINEHNWTQTKKELRNFPKGSDDILDSLSDLFTGKQPYPLTGEYDYLRGNVDEIRRRKREQEAEFRKRSFIEMIENGLPNAKTSPYDVTGGL